MSKPVCPSVCMSKCLVSPTSPLTDVPMLLKLYTVAVYDLRMCMEGDKPGLKYFKGDNQQCRTGVSFCDWTHCSTSLWCSNMAYVLTVVVWDNGLDCDTFLEIVNLGCRFIKSALGLRSHLGMITDQWQNSIPY